MPSRRKMPFGNHTTATQVRASKADQTTIAARAIAESEAALRTAKTEKLKAQRLARDAADEKAARKAAKAAKASAKQRA